MSELVVFLASFAVGASLPLIFLRLADWWNDRYWRKHPKELRKLADEIGQFYYGPIQ